MKREREMELYDKIREKMHDAVTDIFADIQDEYDIKSGDCPLCLELAIENGIDNLSEQIKLTIEFQRGDGND